ncbi:hypothetical protein B0H10DRAFT_1959921 [Mycena sp. CBHHK59/15]|nr:hypothetical protein B0H10DRAFT_1959921 [Mycena sp. CBHHK59/15]
MCGTGATEAADVPHSSCVVQHYVTVQSEGQLKAVKDAANYNVLASHVVGFLFPALWHMQHTLGSTPMTRLATEVVSAQGNTEIYDLGRTSYNHSPTLPPSNHPSRASMDQLEDMLADTIQGSGSDHRSARSRALARNGYHCMVTNTIDANSFEKHKAIKKLRAQTGAAVQGVQTCHIFNGSVLQNIEPGDDYLLQDHRQHVGAALVILRNSPFWALAYWLFTQCASAAHICRAPRKP